MAMTTYYLKARFTTPRAAVKAKSAFESFLDQGRDAESWWQSNCQRKPTAGFWRAFRKAFPLVHDYLGSSAVNGENLSYVLDFGNPDEAHVQVTRNLLLFYAVVWHFTDWDPLVDYLKHRLGARGAAWISEETLDPFELLNP
jgi:hypothetical protein